MSFRHNYMILANVNEFFCWLLITELLYLVYDITVRDKFEDYWVLTTELERKASLVEMEKGRVPAAERLRILQIPRSPPPASPANRPIQDVPSATSFPSTRQKICVWGYCFLFVDVCFLPSILLLGFRGRSSWLSSYHVQFVLLHGSSIF